MKNDVRDAGDLAARHRGRQLAVFVAEIGDVHRFTDPARPVLVGRFDPHTPRTDTVVRAGHITKQVRGALAGPKRI